MLKRILLATTLLASPCYAGDLAPKAPSVIKAPAAQASNSGFYGGFNLIGAIGSNDLVDSTGATSGGGVGGQIGYQFWLPSSSLFAAGEVFGDYDVQALGTGQGYRSSYMFGELAKVGVGLAGLLGGAGAAPAAPSQAPVPVNVPVALSTAMMAPYLAAGVVEHSVPGSVITGWTAGTGVDWAVAQHWNIDLMYLYVTYNSPALKDDNIIKLGLNYKY